jgi:tRNA pseudouridine38-40 synthase
LAWKTKNFKISFLQIHFMRAARTDKGVSAVGQVVSLMMVVNPPGIIDRINAELPPAIRAYGFRRTVKGFDARKACDKRRYEYILPVWMFDPKMEGIYRPKLKKKTQEGEGAKEGEEEDEIEEIEAAAAVVKEEVNDEAPTETMPTGQPYGSDSDFVFDDACIQRLNDILKQYQGTCNFHNFTVRTPATAPQAKRFILSFTCDGIFEINGTKWVRTVVIGQSFMLHQIRKMIGMALAEFRGVAPPGSLKYALGTFHSANTPMAPDLGLFLDECYYDAYNDRWGHQNEDLRLSDWQADVEEFKKERLYPALAKRDSEENVNAIWLFGLKDSNYKFKEWGTRGDYKSKTAAVASVAGEGNNKRPAAGDGGGGRGNGGRQAEVKKAKVDSRVAGNMSLNAEYSE